MIMARQEGRRQKAGRQEGRNSGMKGRKVERQGHKVQR
jgi:hypothetical protein